MLYRLYSYSGDYSDYNETSLGYVTTEEEAKAITEKLEAAIRKHANWREQRYNYLERTHPRPKKAHFFKWTPEERADFDKWYEKRRQLEREYEETNPEPEHISAEGVSWEELEPYVEKE